VIESLFLCFTEPVFPVAVFHTSLFMPCFCSISYRSKKVLLAPSFFGLYVACALSSCSVFPTHHSEASQTKSVNSGLPFSLCFVDQLSPSSRVWELGGRFWGIWERSAGGADGLGFFLFFRLAYAGLVVPWVLIRLRPQ